VNTDQALDQLDAAIRQLGVEYEVFFSAGRRSPPTDQARRVEQMLRQIGERQLSFAQHFRFSQIQQRYSLLSQNWRRRMGIREEGCRRPADRLLSVAGAEAAAAEARSLSQQVCLGSDPVLDQAGVEQLYSAFLRLRERSVDAPRPGTLESFRSFLLTKAQQIRSSEGVEQVEASVALEDGCVRLRLKARRPSV
jgi:hypothetical protein